MQMTPELANAINQVVVALLGLVAVFLAYLLKRGVEALTAYLEVKIGSENTNTVKELARTVVRFLAQSPAFKDLDSAEKFERATIWLDQELKKLGIDIDEDKLAKYIEEAYADFKADIGWSNEEGESLPETG
jgi:hypothetical protein